MRLSRLLFVLLLLCVAQSIAPKAAQASGLSPNINCDIFPADNIWNTPINTLPVDTTSTNVFLNSVGTNRGMHADFGAGQWEGADIGIPYILSGAQAPVTVIYDAYGDESDPGPFPIPLNAPVEGGPNSDGDRHVLVVDDTNCVLYELYRAFPVGNTWHADSGAEYDLNSHDLRPLNWTSADAAGLPILPGLVRYEEILAGSINHAIRFTLSRTADGYVWPARHEAGSYAFSQYLPMGARLRLKDSFNINAFSSDPSVRIILQAMKTYGIILADNGSNMYFSGAPDSRWDDDALHEFGSLTSGNFEVVDTCSMQVSPNSGQAQVGVNPPPNNCTSLSNGGNQFVPSGTTNVGYGNPLYQWMDYLPSAQYYYLLIYNSAGAQVVNEVIADAGNCNGDICSLDPTLLRETYRLVNGGYSAYINTWNGSTQGTWRGPFNFTLSAAPPTIVTIDAPTNTNTLRPTFNWTLSGGALNATYFNLVVSPTNNPSAPSINQWFTRVAACGTANSPSCALASPIDLLDGTNYAIYVRSYGPGGLSTGGIGGYAGPQNFTVDVPAPLLPSGIVVNNNQGRATFTWNDDPNALYFNLYVTNNAGVSQHNAWYARSAVCTGGTCSVAPVLALGNGGYEARVKAWGSGGFSVGGVANSGFGGPIPFTFNFGLPDITGVNTFTPSGIIANGSPTFTWNTIAGTTYYLLWVTGAAPSYTPVYHQVWYDASTICTVHPGTCTVSGVVNLPIGNAVWRVQAYGPGGLSAMHSNIAITVNSTLPAALILNNPTGTITTNAPTFTWVDNSNVDYYNVYINSGASVIVNQWYPAERGAGKLCNAGICSLTLTGTTFANGAYTWNVRAFAPAGVGAWAIAKNFTVNIAAPNAPVLSSPTAGAIINTTNRPTFVWNTTNGIPWYHLEVKNGMGTVIFDQWYGANTGGCNATTCAVQLPNPIAYGGYNWRVQAYTQGGIGTFSPSRSFFSLSINTQPMMVQADSSMVRRGGLWNTTPNELAVDQSYLTSSGSTADTLTFGFTGTEAQVVYIAGPSYGSFVIEVDGVAVSAVNANAAQDSVGNLAQISGLTAGEYTLRIVPLGGAPVAIDALIVDGQVVLAGAPPPIASPTMVIPTVSVTEEVTAVPTDVPTVEVTATPIVTETPTEVPTATPTDTPTIEPTLVPTETPTEVVVP